MTYTVERLSDYPVLLMTYYQDFDVARDFSPSAAEARTILEAEPEPITLILDISDWLMSLDDLLKGTTLASDPANNLGRHPKVKRSITVTKMRMMQLAADGFRKLGIAGELQLVDSLDKALALVASED